MAGKIARKKRVNNNAGYIVMPIAEIDVVKQADFDTFKLIRTKNSIAYTNYVGYTVITKPYTTTPEGAASELSLYSWLNYVLELKEYLDAHKDEQFENLGVTCGEWLETLKVVTEANVTKPCVVFTDSNYAMEEANRHMKWLDEKSKQLLKAMSTPPPEENEKANAKEYGRVMDAVNLSNVLNAESETKK